MPALRQQGLLSPDGVLVRRFEFRPLLRVLEAEVGFVDNGRIMFGDPGGPEFGIVLRAGEVWKDSIAFAHGEYTHRLQWLAISEHFKRVSGWDGPTVVRLYKCAANPVKSIPKQAIQAAWAADKTVSLSEALWNFLVDCFPTNAQAPNQFEPANALAADEAGNPLTYKYAGRTDSYRSPDTVMKLLKTNSTMGLIHAYVLSSYMKAGDGSLSQYRKTRLQDATSARGTMLTQANIAAPDPLATRLTAKHKVDGKNKFVLNQFVPNDGGLMLK